MRRPIPVLLVLAAACGHEGKRAHDDDAGLDDGGDIEVTEPEAPRFLPCPDGWRAVEDPDRPGLVTCDPWPEGGPEDCPNGDVHWPGGAGCEPIGPPCPKGDFATDLPDRGPIVFVKAGADPGGIGSRDLPYATIAEGVANAPEGGIVAVARGTYEECVMFFARTLWGACVAQTIVTCDGSVSTTLSLGWDSTVRNIQIRGPATGIDVYARNTVLESVLVQGTGGEGLNLSPGSEPTDHVLTARDLVVRDCGFDGPFHRAGLEQYGGRAEILRAVFERNAAQGILVQHAFDTGPEIVLRDVAVRDTVGVDTEVNGLGIRVLTASSATGSARLALERAVLDGNRTAGLYVSGDGPPAEISLTDVLVRETESPAADWRFGLGISLGNARGSLERVVVERSRAAGLSVESASTVDASDVVVRDTRSRTEDDDGGDGIVVLGATELELRRAYVAGNRRGGIVVAQEGTVATMEDVVVTRTLEAGCATDWCAGAGGGCGIAALGGATTLTHFESSANALCGVQVYAAGELDLHEGLVSGNPVGANVQVDGYDIARLRDRVLYRDNDRTLDTSALPVPVPLGGIDQK